jgi:hypothetical protein
MTLKDAYILVKKRKSNVSPNIGFLSQLLIYEKKLLGTNSLEEKDLRTINTFV